MSHVVKIPLATSTQIGGKAALGVDVDQVQQMSRAIFKRIDGTDALGVVWN